MERSKDWMAQAKRDLDASRNALKGGFYEWACFASQQAAEKALKAVYQSLNIEAFGHSVLGLVKSLPRQVRAPRGLKDYARELDKAYIPTRYPNAHPEGVPFEFYSKADAERMITYAGKVIGFCEGVLSKI